MKVDVMVFRFSKSSSSALTSPSAGNTAQRGQATRQGGPAPEPPLGFGEAAPGVPGGAGTVGVGVHGSRLIPQSPRHLLWGAEGSWAPSGGLEARG